MSEEKQYQERPVPDSAYWVRGNTFPIKDQLKANGFYFNKKEGSWWTLNKAKAAEWQAKVPAFTPRNQSAPNQATAPKTVTTSELPVMVCPCCELPLRVVVKAGVPALMVVENGQ